LAGYINIFQGKVLKKVGYAWMGLLMVTGPH